MPNILSDCYFLYLTCQSSQYCNKFYIAFWTYLTKEKNQFQLDYCCTIVAEGYSTSENNFFDLNSYCAEKEVEWYQFCFLFSLFSCHLKAVSFYRILSKTFRIFSRQSLFYLLYYDWQKQEKTVFGNFEITEDQL